MRVYIALALIWVFSLVTMYPYISSAEDYEMGHPNDPNSDRVYFWTPLNTGGVEMFCNLSNTYTVGAALLTKMTVIYNTIDGIGIVLSVPMFVIIIYSARKHVSNICTHLVVIIVQYCRAKMVP
jgi:hypothetical protein